jgi:hypothetical protein
VKPLLTALLLLCAGPALAQTAPAPVQNEQVVAMGRLLEALRANTDAQQKNAAAVQELTSALTRVETATRAVPPSVEGLRTDVVAIRAMVDRLTQATRRGAATLRFAPFACSNDSAASCAANACKSVGYANGVVVSAIRDGAGNNAKTTGISEATCFD